MERFVTLGIQERTHDIFTVKTSLLLWLHIAPFDAFRE